MLTLMLSHNAESRRFHESSTTHIGRLKCSGWVGEVVARVVVGGVEGASISYREGREI